MQIRHLSERGQTGGLKEMSAGGQPSDAGIIVRLKGAEGVG